MNLNQWRVKGRSKWPNLGRMLTRLPMIHLPTKFHICTSCCIRQQVGPPNWCICIPWIIVVCFLVFEKWLSTGELKTAWARTPKINPTPYVILWINVSKHEENRFSISNDKVWKHLCTQTKDTNTAITWLQIFWGRINGKCYKTRDSRACNCSPSKRWLF